ncbi:hypothetical protein BKA82DRAFT_25004 [Pisolithus tinctorius]|nr:hypothetical protein BKA82DRAFT_25004 [Pisolithus tinctorius]
MLTTPPVDGDEYNLKHWLERWTSAWANIDSLAQEASSGQLEIPSTDKMVAKLLGEAQRDAKSISNEITHHLEAVKSKEVNDVSMGDSTAGMSGSQVQSHQGGSTLPKGKNKSKEVFDGVESLLLPPKPSQPMTAAKMPPCVFCKVDDTVKGPNLTNALTTLEALKKHQKAAANDPDVESQATLSQGTKCQSPQSPSTAYLTSLAHPLASSFNISHHLKATEESKLCNLRSLATLQAAIVSNAEEIAMLCKIALGRKEY